MNYKQTGFRAFYHHFCVLPLRKELAYCIEGFPRADEANAYLTYGYIDSEKGLSLEVVAAARVNDDGVEFFDPAKDVRSFIRIDVVAEDPFGFEADEKGELAERYAEKIAVTKEYAAEEDIEKTRDMSFLDPSRDEVFVDDVLVYLLKEGNKPEGCWTRIVGLGDHFFIGVLLNEPDQDFGFHEGDRIAFCVQETEDKKVICVSDMNPIAKITREDLEDGSMLEAAVHKFNEERNEANFVELMEILRDSYVWVPCNAVMSETDQKRLRELVENLNLNGNSEELKDVEFVSKDKTRLIPDILQNGDAFFFPIFSTAEAMGEYGNDFSKVQKHILEVIPLARNNEKELVGIVLNAFSEPFVLDRKIWDIVENMKSRIEEE